MAMHTVSKHKAGEILKHGEVRGHALTKKQKDFSDSFAEVASQRDSKTKLKGYEVKNN